MPQTRPAITRRRDSVTSSFSAEILKLRKRPAAWVLGIIFAVLTVFFGYLSTYFFLVRSPDGAGIPQQARDGALQFLLPESVLTNVIGIFAQFGGALALILGALAIGSEYGWDTFKVSLTQRPGRLSFFAGKLAAVGLVMLLLTIVILAIGAVTSYFIAVAETASVDWPSVGEVFKGIGAGWLTLGTFAAIGIFLATLFRGTALAIGIGLVYLLVLENLFLGLAGQNETVAAIGKRFPAKNAIDLSESFGQFPPGFGAGAPGETVEPAIAALTLGIYTVAFLVVAVILFKSRDVT
jgi:ABC-type transport system involved in multi-copper enzyme maturation permease subunit